jgi:tetratricopeptide (TPR) repeat protein
MLRAGFIRHRDGFGTDAANRYAVVLHDDPDNATALSNLSHLLSAAGQHDCAIALSRRAVEIEPGALGPIINLARALRAVGQHKVATDLLEVVTLADSSISVAWHLLGQTHQFAGNFDKAIECYDEAIEINPSSSEARQIRHDKAIALLAAGRWSDGLREFEARWYKTENNEFCSILSTMRPITSFIRQNGAASLPNIPIKETA